MAEPIVRPGREALAAYMRQILDQRHMSGRLLARTAGISEATVRSIVSPEKKKDLLGPHPLVIRAIANALGLDTVHLMYLAGYLEGDEQSDLSISPEGAYFAYRLERLPADKQRILWDMLDAFEKSSDLKPLEEHSREVLRRLHAFRRDHPMFRRRRFSMRDEIGVWLGHVTRTTTPEFIIDKFIALRLNELFGESLGQPITREQVEEVTAHPDATLILNDLLPRKEIPTGWEKLFWLMHPAGTGDKHADSLSPEQQAGIKALWQLLVEVAESA